MPGFLGVKKNAAAAGTPPPGGGFKNFAIEAAPLFASLAAGYSSGRGPYAYMDQGLAAIQQRQKDRRDQEAAAAATAAFKGLMPGGMGGVTRSTMGGGVSAPAPVDPNSPDAVANAAMAALGKPPGGSTDWLKYSNSGATRNDPLDPKLVNAMSFLSDMGITMDVISGGQEAAGEGGARTGSTRHDHGGAADVDFYMGGRKLDWNNPNDMPILTQIVQRAKTNGVTGIGAGDDYMGAGRFHVGFGNPGVWGAGGKGANAPDWLTAAYNGAPGGDVTMSAKDGGGLAMGGPMDPMADPYVQQLMTVMAMPGLTPEQQSVVQLQLQSRIDMLSRPQPGAEEEAARAMRARDADLLGYQRGSPEWTQYVVTGQQPTAAKPIEVGGVLLDPVTYQPIFDSRKPDPGYTMVPAAEVAQLGLPPGAYQRGADGKISQIGGGGTSVTVNNGGAPDLGKLSTDYGYVLDPATGLPKIDPTTGLPIAAPVPGSPAAMEAANAGKKAEAQLSGAETASSVITTAADRALDANSKRSVGGPLGAAAAYNPSSENAETYRQVEVLKANATIENLQAMRNESPTGGALGNVTEGEGRMLQAQAGALDPASPNFERDLLDYTRTLLRTVHGKKTGDAIFEQKYGEKAKGDAGGALPTVSAPSNLPDGVTQQEWNAMTPEERALFQ
jgi:hypothetical protein